MDPPESETFRNQISEKGDFAIFITLLNIYHVANALKIEYLLIWICLIHTLFIMILGPSSFDRRKNKWRQWRKRIWSKINSSQLTPSTSLRSLQQTQRLLSQPTVPSGQPCRPGTGTVHSSQYARDAWVPTPSHYLFTTQWVNAHPTYSIPHSPRPTPFSASHSLIAAEQQPHSAKFQLPTKLEFRGAIQTGRNF